MLDEVQSWIAFAQHGKIGPVRFSNLYKTYDGDLAKAWEEIPKSLAKSGFDHALVEDITAWKQTFDSSKTLNTLNSLSISTVRVIDENYPKLLKEIADPPPVLFYKGEISGENDEFAVAIVGSRKPTNYGITATKQFAREIANFGLPIVSGLALGIDAIAHRATLPKRTMAVLGSGLAEITPFSNQRLGTEIIANGGAIISEFPLFMPPLPQNFPTRNRIISGLSLGTIIIEGAESSGSLITARSALDQNREVFALPGPIYSANSMGPNNLLKMGAHPLTSAQDVIQILNLEEISNFQKAKKIYADSANEAKLLEHLSKEPITADEISKLCDLDMPTINSTLMLMEMKGKVRNVGSATYVIAR